MKLGLGADEVLSTTRAVRKRLDFTKPVPMEILRECVGLATQAPTGSNAQGWHFVFVTDPAKKEKIAAFYRARFAAYRAMEAPAQAPVEGREGPDPAQQERVIDSATYLAEHMGEAPVLMIPCVEGRVDQRTGPMANLAGASLYGSILPATWSFMLAARERGLGTAWTTLHLLDEKPVAELLGIPFERVMQVALVPIAYTKGTDFKPARRRPLDPVVHVDGW